MTVTDTPPLPGTEAAAGATAPPAAPAASRPRKARAAKKDAPPKVGRPSNDDRLAAKVAELYGAAAMGVMFTGNTDLAGRIAEHADELGAAWVKLANEYPSVRRLLDRLVATSAIGAFAAVHFSVFGPELLALLPGARPQAPAPGATPDAPEAPAPEGIQFP
jgi:hypothetical protein